MAIIPPVQRIEALETLAKRLERELAALADKQRVEAGVWELQYNRLVAYMEGQYEPRLQARCDKTARDPIRVADFASGHKKAMGS